MSDDEQPSDRTTPAPNAGGLLGLGIVMLVIAVSLTIVESTRPVGFTFLAIGASLIAIGAALSSRNGGGASSE
ncbi:hypothetical protein [Microcella alkalica]|uniref:hypothetical protein n=1 Tax=Microcella alkalica TaxID=355930 RepID=UPI00145E6617|nr:hypothetical protein [Microcella alkalica]